MEGKNAATIVEYIEKKTADIASGTDFSTLTGRVDTAEGKITALEALTGTDGKIAKDIAKALTDAEGYADGKAADAQAAAEATAKGYTDDTVAGLDVATVGATGSYVKTVAQVNGQLEAQAEAFQTSIKKIDESNPETSLVAPTAKAVYDFVDTELGILNVGMTGVEGDIADLQAQLAEGGTTKEAIDAAQQTADDAVTVNTQQQAAIEKNASDIAANKTAAETGIQEAKDAAAAANTAAGTALADAKKYADDQDVAQTATIKAAYELADTNLKSDLEDYADAQAKAVADTLKLLATAPVPEECVTENGSNMCVLTMTTAGTFAWTPLTTPVE